jgi:outer membrane protein assembly factor BamB
MRIPLVAAVVVALGTGVVAWAENWPEFRGPTGQGHAQGTLPIEWGPDKNVAWKQNIPGHGWSSPVVWEGRIYLTTAVPDTQSPTNDLSLRALCLDAKSGRVIWDVEAIRQPGDKVPPHQRKNSDASPTPIVDGKRLFVHFGHLGTACLDLDGKVLWRNLELRYSPVHGNGGSPILADDLLVFSIDGSDKQRVVALEQATGKVKWQTDRRSTAPKKFSFSTPLLIEVGEQKQIISPGSNVVVSYDAKTGAEIWRVHYTGYSVIPRPVFGHGLLFLSSCYDSPTFYAIRPDGKGDVTQTHVAWSTKAGAPHTPSALLVGDELYTVSDRGTATCWDAKTGKVHWAKRLGRNDFSASPILADGKVYFQDEEGVGYVVKASTTFELLATNDMKERTLSSYAVADGCIFLRTAERLYRIEKK